MSDHDALTTLVDGLVALSTTDDTIAKVRNRIDNAAGAAKAKFDPVTPPPPARPYDLVIDDVLIAPANPVAGDHVVPSAVVRNAGGSTMFAGTVALNTQLAVGFYLDGVLFAWADRYEGSLAPGASVTLTANGHPGDAAGAIGINYWTAVQGTHQIRAVVNEIVERKPGEGSTANNTRTETFTVTAPAQPPPSTVVPTEANTGPRVALTGSITMQQWIAAGHAEHVTITGVRDEQAGLLYGKVLTATDCVLPDFYYMENSEIPDSQFPKITLDHCACPGISLYGGVYLTADWCKFIGQSYSAAGRPWIYGYDDHNPNQIPRNVPWRITNSLLHSPLPVPRSQGGQGHMEALHMVGACVGARFTNVVFIQDGNWPVEDSNVTGIVKTTGIDSVYTDCEFRWNGTPPAYFSLNMEGRNVQMIRCKAQAGSQAFFFNENWPGQGSGVFSPIGGGGSNQYTMPVCTDCTDLVTGASFRAGN